MTRRRFQGAKRIDARSEYHDEAMERLVGKLRKWLIAQPEWVGVLSAPRQDRKRYGARVADEVTRIPPMVKVSQPRPKSVIAKAEQEADGD